MEKRKITLTAIILGVVLVALFGSTYAYFTSNNDPQNSAQAIIQTGALSLILDDVDGITEEDKIDANHTEIVKYFSITNNGTQDAYAKLIFKGLTNTFVRDDLVYELEEVQSDKSSFSTPRIELSETVVPKSSSPSNQVLADSIFIEKGTLSNNTVTPNTKYYKLTVKYKYSDTVNQNEDLGATLVSGFTIEEGTYQTRLLTTNGVEMRLDNSNISTTIAPNGSIQKKFRLRNNTTSTQKVDVELTNITNTSEDVTASLTNGNTVIVNNKEIPIVTNETVTIKKGLEVSANDEENYTITINNNSTESTNITGTLNTKQTIKLPISCVDVNGNDIACSTTLNHGDRIAIGTGENKQYFRYLRTTDTTKQLAECGTTSSSPCADAANGKLRLLADYPLRGNGNTIPSDSLQDSNAQNGSVRYGLNNADYTNSYIRTYVTNYANYLNSLFFSGTNYISGDILNLQEIRSFNWGCPQNTNGQCTNMPTWFKNTYYNYSYWTRTPYDSRDLYRIEYGIIYANGYYSNSHYVRPVIEIDQSLL